MGKTQHQARVPTKSARAAFLILLGLACVGVLISITGIGLVDDAYISLRYARNFARGMGLVYNLGERVDGYTSFLWTFGIGCLAWFSLSPVWMALLAGLLFALMTVLYLVHRNPWRKDLGWMPAFVLLFSPCFVFWSGSGLETAFFTFLLAVAVLRFIRECRSIEKCRAGESLLPPHFTSGVLLGLACLTRMEGVLLLTVNLATLIILLRRGKIQAWLSVVWHLVSFGTVFGVWFLWHWWYYSHPFPNTYYCKVWGGGYELWLRGLRHVTEFSLATICLPVFSVLSFVLSRDWRERYLAATILVLIGGVVRVGGDHFALYRFLVPVLPLLALLVPLWFQRLLAPRSREDESRSPSRPLPSAPLQDSFSFKAAFPRWRSTAAFALYLVISATVCLLSFENHRSARLILEGTRGWAKTGRWFAFQTPPDESIATQAIGAIGYYSERSIIDILGLVDEHIAHLPVRVGRGFPGHEKHDAVYTLSRNPTYIVLGHSGRVPLKRDRQTVVDIIFQGSDFLRGEQEIIASPGFDERYEFESIALGDGTFIECFRLRDR